MTIGMNPRIWPLFGALAVCGCSTALEVQTVGRPGWESPGPRDRNCPLVVHAIGEELDPGCREVGDVFVGDTGSSTDCGWDRMIDTVRMQGCFYGADAAQIVRHREPSFWESTCHQVRARLLSCGESRDDL